MTMLNKRELRAYIRGQAQSAVVRQAQSHLICQHILSSDSYRNANVIVGYVPLKWEADIVPVLEQALRSGKRVLLPRCGKAPNMTLHSIGSLSELTPGAYGIQEPPEDAPEVSVSVADLILVPLEGIDALGYRLGKGGGYYDHLLANQKVATMGCALSWQCVETVPHDVWDVPLTMCASTSGLHVFKA